MATYELTGYDRLLVRQSIIEIVIKIDVYDKENKYLDSIDCGVISASFNINAESDIRRTATLELIPFKSVNSMIDEESLIWINRNINLSIGIKDMRTEEYTYYKQGTYIIMDGSSTYEAVTNTLSLNCSDWMAKLDGSRNGNLGQLKIDYPADEYYMTTNWVKMANAYGSVSSEADVYNWINSYEEYQNLVTMGSQQLKDAAWQLCTNYNNLNQTQRDNYMNLIKTVYPNAELDYWHTKVNGTSFKNVNIFARHKIRDAIDTTLGQLGYIKNRNIDFVGERKGMPYYTSDWDYLAYRQQYPTWDDIPFDQEFTSGTTVLNIITTLRDLYEGYETFFDIDNTFCCQLMPTGQDDPTILYNDFFEKMIISENFTINYTEPKNVLEVWGAVLETDFYASSGVGYSNNIYTMSIPGYDEAYFNGDKVAIAIPSNNLAGASININNLGAIPIYDENYEVPILANMMDRGETYVFHIKKSRVNGQEVTRAYLAGQWQCHAMAVLTDGTTGENYHTTSGTTVAKYSKEYFQDVYQCKDVYMDIIPDSPFTIQKMGVVLSVYSDDKNIQSSSTALETARQELYRAARLTDNINLTIRFCPFLDVNWKVEYKRSDKDLPEEYLIKSISHDISAGTTQLTLIKYYPLYIETET